MGKTLFTRFVQVGWSVYCSRESHIFKCKRRLEAKNMQSKWRLNNAHLVVGCNKFITIIMLYALEIYTK